jgi:hypothetical protein
MWPDAGLVRPVVEIPQLAWQEVLLPWQYPFAATIGVVDAGVVVFTSVFPIPLVPNPTNYMADWNEGAGIHNIRAMDSYEANGIRLRWNGALLTEHSYFDGTSPKTELFAPGGVAHSTHIYNAGYAKSPNTIMIGGAVGNGEAWLVRDPSYETGSSLDNTYCPQRTVEFYKRETDGGFSGQLCPFEPEYARVGPPSVPYHFEWSSLHPTRRLYYWHQSGFVEFSERGKITRFSGPFANRNELPSWWPSQTDPPMAIASVNESPSGSPVYIHTGVFEYRWEDAGVVKRLSVLNGITENIQDMTATSRGIVVRLTKTIEPIDEDTRLKDGGLFTAPDGGLYKLLRYRIIGPTAFYLLSDDGQKILGIHDMKAGGTMGGNFIGETNGKIYAFKISRDSNAAGHLIQRLYFAPLDL